MVLNIFKQTSNDTPHSQSRLFAAEEWEGGRGGGGGGGGGAGAGEVEINLGRKKQ